MFLLITITFFVSITECAVPNVFCMIRHCSSEMKDCVQDTDCTKAMVCITGCSLSNQTCEFDCLYSYEDDVFDSFMKCIVTDYKCMEIPPPNPPVVCHRPPTVATSFDISHLAGTWFIVLGKNPIYDCFDCQNTTFVKGQGASFSAIEHFDVNTIDGSIKHRTVTDTVTLWNATTSGILKYGSIQMGHETTSEWRVLDFGPDYIFTYYCGSISANYFFEGSVVYSRTTSLSTDSMAKIEKTATAAGLDLRTYCKPGYDKCL